MSVDEIGPQWFPEHQHTTLCTSLHWWYLWVDWWVPLAWPFLQRMARLLCLMMLHPSWGWERRRGPGRMGKLPLITLLFGSQHSVHGKPSTMHINIIYRYPCQEFTSRDLKSKWQLTRGWWCGGDWLCRMLETKGRIKEWENTGWNLSWCL